MLRFGAGLVVALVVLPGPIALAQAHKPTEKAQTGSTPPLPERKAANTTPAAPPAPDVWSPAEIEAAKASCTAALKGLNAVVSYEAPIKEGDCGNPAPIRLSKLDNVTFTPAALINCGMLAPLHTWISKDLQPLAARQLRGRLTSIQVMSDYSCRTAFGRVGKKLSQHAYVDALDIRGFVTDKGAQVSVLSDWGITNRDIAAAKAREEKLARAGADKAGQQQAATATAAPDKAPGASASLASGLLKPTRIDGGDVVTAILPGGLRRQQVAARLGGPLDNKASDAKPAVKGSQKAAAAFGVVAPNAAPPEGAHARFLREAHTAACRIFGTTLGPEANEMHRNHFHVDMAERKIKKICD